MYVLIGPKVVPDRAQTSEPETSKVTPGRLWSLDMRWDVTGEERKREHQSDTSPAPRKLRCRLSSHKAVQGEPTSEDPQNLQLSNF
mmetsp:Transcript_26417/g.41294  ORF Transcript_26417/g.41294 Transcript_26417/m.41294 type:complete len:86 (-) Transcript_26417:289-546(-)